MKEDTFGTLLSADSSLFPGTMFLESVIQEMPSLHLPSLFLCRKILSVLDLHKERSDEEREREMEGMQEEMEEER